MHRLAEGWFSEINNALWPGQCMSLRVSAVLHHERSPHQDITIVQTTHHGRALILDDVIQCTESDEFAYQEMMAMLPLCAHRAPRSVLIVGGGDGGVAREVVKHPCVERVRLVEIDARVMAAAQRHLPSMACGLAHARVEVVVGDGLAHMRQSRDAYDVIITDSSDPVGPAEALFTADYYAAAKAALREGGVLCAQAGSIWTGLPQVAASLQQCRAHLANVGYALVAVPTYPSGQIGVMLATEDARMRLAQPQHVFAPPTQLRYYDEQVHRAAFVLPHFAKVALRLEE